MNAGNNIYILSVFPLLKPNLLYTLPRTTNTAAYLQQPTQSHTAVIFVQSRHYLCTDVTRLPHLTVSDLGVAVSVGGEDTSQCRDAGGVLEGGMVRQRAVKVPLNLLRGQAALAHRLLHQAGVIALMRLQLGGRICTNQRYRDVL